jgi:4-hydroxy-tetrahydrodipicolinate reductase
MNLTLVGFGKLGTAIAEAASHRGHHIARTFTELDTLTRDSFSDADVLIDVSTPAAFLKNLPLLLASGKPIVVGTTGWYGELENVKRLVLAANGSLLYASNFSLGVNLFFRVVKEASRLINKFDEFDVAVSETHHTEKLDAPSGTAIKTAQVILSEVKRKTAILRELPKDKKIEPSALHVSSMRLGKVFGQHTVAIDSASDEILVSHTAKNRTGFASGAVQAAEWLADAKHHEPRKGFFSMDDFLNETFNA